MAQFLENFGLDFFTEEEETFTNLMKFVASEGKPITGYYGLPYFNHHFGEVQIILNTEHNDSGEGLSVTGLDTHASGRAVWEVRLSEVNIDRKDKDTLSKRVVVSRMDGSGGMAVVNLVNADVMPSFLEGDTVKMQMIAFPKLIEYFESEEAYEEKQPKMKNGGSFCLAEGTVFPTGMLRNRNPEDPDFEQSDDLDDLTAIRGTVKGAYWGKFEMNGESDNTFIRCVIDTEFGPLDIVHTAEQVSEEYRENIKVGATVSFYGTLSGDVAIYEYDEGIIRDEEHNLAAMRYVFSGNDPDRIKSILSEDVVYSAEYNGTKYLGPQEVVDRLKFVQQDNEDKHIVQFATITQIDAGEEELEYDVGKRCLVIAQNEETNYTSIVFIELDKNENIVKLTTSQNSRYHFTFDQKPEINNPLEDFEFPKSVSEAIKARALFHGILKDEEHFEVVLCDSANLSEFENNAKQMLEALPADVESDNEELLANLFGYLFAKAIEYTCFSSNPIDDGCAAKLVCSYSPSDAWEGRIQSNFDEEKHALLENAFDLGKQFYKDFKFQQTDTNADAFRENIINALILVQNLGSYYSKYF